MTSFSDREIELVYQYVGGRIQWYRKAQGVTQETLARSCAIGRTSITNIENGTQRVALHILFQIAQVLDVTIDDLLPQYFAGKLAALPFDEIDV